MPRETVGKIATDLSQKAPETRDPIEQMREQLTDYDKNIIECIESHKKQYTTDFYVIVITKKERLLQNVIRNYFTARLSCPTPEYDQVVYKYKRNEDSIDFLWVVPSKDTCQLLLANKHQVVPEEYGLLNYIIQFADGTLFALAKKLNGEKIDSPHIES